MVNISSNDIVDGNPKLTLGLVWSIILHWQVRKTHNASIVVETHILIVVQVQDVLKGSMAELQQSSLDKTLLSWCQEATKVIKLHTKHHEWMIDINKIPFSHSALPFDVF